jgi:membrane-bound lytic murein transglycosylase B
MTRTITFPFRKVCSGLSTVALIGGGIVLSGSPTPTAAPHLGLVSSRIPAVVVPNIAMTPPGSERTAVDTLHAQAVNASAANAVGASTPAPKAPGSAPRPVSSIPPAGTAPGSTAAVTLDSAGIPVRALEGYRKAATLTGAADPTCHIDWALLAAIGRVESNHGRFGGNQLDAAGIARPGIIGIPLDGLNGTALVPDTDHGLLDRDTVYDRAVGPMQFIPSTWRVDGVDADGDGVKNPQDMADAATATAVYLCSGPGDLRRPADLGAAILRYNDSDSYVQLVTSIADAYRHGVSALPASDLTATTTSATSPAEPATSPATPAATRPAPARPSTTQTKVSGPHRAPALPAATTSPRTSAPSLPRPASRPAARATSAGRGSNQPAATPTPTRTQAPATGRGKTSQPSTAPGHSPSPTTPASPTSTAALCENSSGDVRSAAKPNGSPGKTAPPTPALARCCIHDGDLDHGSKHGKIPCLPSLPSTVPAALP